MDLHKKTKFQRLVRSLSHTMREFDVTEEAIIGAALANWCKQSFPGLPKSELLAPLALQRVPAVIDFVELIKVDELQEATYWLSSAYAQLVGEKHRKHLAMFFTPPSLTTRLLDELAASDVNFDEHTFCDPACGGAAFLTPIAMRMRDGLYLKGLTPKQILKHIEKRLYGIEKDETLCKLSRHFLLMALHDEIVTTGKTPKFNVLRGDSLLEASNIIRSTDVVICNPPFRKITATETEVYLDEFSDVIEGQPNLYVLFMARCVKLLKPEGICALVTPTSFLSGHNFSKLRAFLMTHTKLLSIGLVSARHGVFIDVQQETAITFSRLRDDRHRISTVARVFVASLDGKYENVGKCLLSKSSSIWPIPRVKSDVQLLRSAALLGGTIADYGYKIRVGSFVWNRDCRTTYASAKSAARAKGSSAVPLLWSSDIGSDGQLKFDDYTKANKEPRFVNLGSKSHPSVVRRPSVILQRVTSNDQPRRLIAATVPKSFLKKYGGFVGENHTVILEQTVSNPALSPAKLAQLLGAPTVDRFFRCISGATNVSVFELNQLRLPNLHRLKSLLAQGYDVVEAARRSLNYKTSRSKIRK